MVMVGDTLLPISVSAWVYLAYLRPKYNTRETWIFVGPPSKSKPYCIGVWVKSSWTDSATIISLCSCLSIVRWRTPFRVNIFSKHWQSLNGNDGILYKMTNHVFGAFSLYSSTLADSWVIKFPIAPPSVCEARNGRRCSIAKDRLTEFYSRFWKRSPNLPFCVWSMSGNLHGNIDLGLCIATNNIVL